MTRLPSHIKDEPHIRLWANYFDDADAEGLSLPTATAYLVMACRCRQLRSDGWIHDTQVAKLGIPGWKRHLAALEAVGWVQGHPDTAGRTRWLLRGYRKWNLTEEDYARSKHNGRLGGCRSRHPQPCSRADCMESQAWLGEHPNPPLDPPFKGDPNPPLDPPLDPPFKGDPNRPIPDQYQTNTRPIPDQR